MTKEQLRIVFMGTPEFAVPSLEILVNAGLNIVGVITAPDKPKGRGQEIATSAVKEYGIKAGLKILQPTNLKDPGFLNDLKQLNANLQVVVAFRMLPESVWDMPSLGTFNLHASMLPQYRGAAPINWVVMNGEKQTGVTTFFLKHKIDTGNIIFQQNELISHDDTAGTLYERLMKKGAQLVLDTTKAIEEGDIQPIAQNDTLEIKEAPKIFTPTCEINWQQNSENVYNFIRGLSPYPGAWTKWDDKRTIKIFKSQLMKIDDNDSLPGERKSDNKSYLRIKTGNGWLDLEEVQLQGKKRMHIDEFLRGNKI